MKNIILIFTLIFCLSGCGFLEKELNNDYSFYTDIGYNYKHFTSCGPEALSNLSEKSMVSISKDILTNSTFLEKNTRNIFSFFLFDANGITWKNELKRYLYMNNYKFFIYKKPDLILVNKIYSYDNKWGIVLIKKKNSFLKYHWEYFSKEKPLETKYILNYKLIELYTNYEKKY